MCPWLTPNAVHWIYLSDFTTDRIVGNAIPKAGDASGKWIWRADSTILSNYTREYHITTNTGSVTTKNKILASQYAQPVTEWIFLELTVLGLEPSSLDFTR